MLTGTILVNLNSKQLSAVGNSAIHFYNDSSAKIVGSNTRFSYTSFN